MCKHCIETFWAICTKFVAKLCSQKPKLMKRVFWPLSWPWHDLWPIFEKNRYALGSSCWQLSIAACPVYLRRFVPNWTSSLWWPLVTWSDIDLHLGMTYQGLQFVFLTCWRVLAVCDQSALRCLGSWSNIVEACNFDLWPDLDLTCSLLKKKIRVCCWFIFPNEQT